MTDLRYFIVQYGDGSNALVSNPDGFTGSIREVTREEALDYYKTVETLDIVSVEIAAEFDQ